MIYIQSTQSTKKSILLLCVLLRKKSFIHIKDWYFSESMMEDGEAEPAPTRKRKFSKREVLALLKEKEGDLEKVVGEIYEELVPFVNGGFI